MSGFEQELQRQLDEIRSAGLYRELRRIDSGQDREVTIGGQPILNFSSNDYLGLARHPALVSAASKALTDFGAGSGASRLICGSLAVHHDLEQSLAEFKRVPAALVFSTGYAAALGAINAIVAKGDVLVLDKLVHASIVDAARLSEAKLRVFAHGDMEELARILQWAEKQPGPAASGRSPRVLIVTESVFSMDGDLAPLRELVELKDRHGAWLMVDEAHATGLFGERRAGLIEAFGLTDRVEVQMGTLGKALGSAGGYIAGSGALIDLLVNRARSFIFSTAPVPAASAAAAEAIRILQTHEGEERRVRLWKNVDAAKNGLIAAGWALSPVQSPIIPLMVGKEAEALRLAQSLLDQHILIPAIRYPTVARNSARLRLTVSASHSTADFDRLVSALRAPLKSL